MGGGKTKRKRKGRRGGGGAARRRGGIGDSAPALSQGPQLSARPGGNERQLRAGVGVPAAGRVVRLSGPGPISPCPAPPERLLTCAGWW